MQLVLCYNFNVVIIAGIIICVIRDTGAVLMKYKAVIFDLFETLITEWGHKKYTKNEMCSDLGIEREKFDQYWNEKENVQCY